MRFKSLILLFILFFSLSLHAEQDSSSAETTADTLDEKENPIARQSDLIALKDIIDDQTKRAVLSAYTINISGLGTIGFTNTQFHDFKSDKTHNLTFTPPWALLTLRGNLREDPKKDFDLRYTTAFFFSNTGVNIYDFNLVWDIFTTKRRFDPLYTLSTTFGQFLIPFGSDNLATEDKKPTIKSAQYIGRYGNFSRDIGIKFDQGFFIETDNFTGISTPKIALSLALVNGSGPNTIDSLDKRAKDVIAKVTVSPVQKYFTFFGQFSFGGSAWWKNLDWIDSTDKLKSPISRYTAEFSWLKKPLLITGEWVRGNDSAITKDVPGKRSQSLIGTVFYTPNALPDFQPLVRFDQYDPDIKNSNSKSKGSNNDKSTIITLGFNWFFYQVEPLSRRSYAISETNRVIKIQANYNIKLEEENGEIKNKVDNNELVLQAQFSF